MKNNRSLPIFLLLAASILIAAIKAFLLPEHFYIDGSFAPIASPSIGVVSIEGVIFESKDIVDRVEKLRKEDNIKGIVVTINTPGGAVAPSQEIYDALIRARENKPVFASMGSMATSGGYYIASAANTIFANPGTLTGSIGVILQLPKYSELMDKIGISIRTITAGEKKAAGNPYEELSPENRAYFQSLIDETHKQFIEHIAVGRKVEIEAIEPYANGELFTGSIAKERGLIDSLGGEAVAIKHLLEKLELPASTPVIYPKKPHPLMEMLGEVTSPIRGKKAVFQSGLFFISPEFI